MIEVMLGNRTGKPEQILRLRVNSQAAQDITVALTRLDAEIKFQNGAKYNIQGDAATKFPLTIPSGAGEIVIKLNKRPGTGEVRFSLADVTNTRITDVVEWGNLDPEITLGFFGSQNLTSVPSKAPNSYNIRNMFQKCSNFNSPAVVTWNTSHITDMTGLFIECSVFNQPIGNWDTSNVTNMVIMFLNCSEFNQPIGQWNVSKVTNLGSIFARCTKFNQNLNTWDTSNVTAMNSVFQDCRAFNQPVNLWNLSKVKTIALMFNGCAAFDQEVNTWDTVNVTTMQAIFYGASVFNKTITNWKVSKITDLSAMFQSATLFNQNLSSMVFPASATRIGYDTDAVAWNPAYRPKFA